MTTTREKIEAHKEQVKRAKGRIKTAIASAAVVIGGANVATDAEAQTLHINANGTYTYTPAPQGNSGQQSQQGGRTMSADQFQQTQAQVYQQQNQVSETERSIAMWEAENRCSLAQVSPDAYNDIVTHNYIIDLGYSRGLNQRDQLYIVAVRDVRSAGKIGFLPTHNQVLRPNARHTNTIRPIWKTEAQAVNDQQNHLGAYKLHPEYFPTITIDARLPGGGRATINNRGGVNVRDRNGNGIQRDNRGNTRVIVGRGGRR